MRGEITQQDIDEAIGEASWDLGNKVLYNLCIKYPLHEEDDVIIAKVLLIGRVYAAAIERRRKEGEKTGDAFYTQVVAPTIRKSLIDLWIAKLPVVASKQTADEILSVHDKVMKLFHEISGLEKRSLASKYLHFHRPNLYFIYDSRAMSGIRRSGVSSQDFISKWDKEYSHFYWRCLQLRDDLQAKFRRQLTPRDLDKILLRLSGQK